MKTISYSSKIDLWILILFCIASVFLLFAIRQCYLQKNLFSSFMMVYLLMVLAVIWLPVFNTKYALNDTHLIVRCLFFKWKIKFEDIKSVETIRDFSAAPALSVDRVQIQYTENGVSKSLSISPVKLTDFVNRLSIK